MSNSMHSIKIEAGNEIFHKPVNARMMELYTNAFDITEELDVVSNTLKSIKIGNHKITVGDKFSHKYEEIPSTYNILKIERGANPNYNYRNKYTIFSHLRNKTTDYVLPCLCLNNTFNNHYFDVDGYLVNAYLGKDDTLHLMYRFAKTDYYGKLEERMINHPNFLKFNNSIPGFDVFIFNIPDSNLKDADLFKLGKYSKMSQEIKLKIKNFYKLSEKSNLWKILIKDESLVKQMEDSFRTPRGFFWNVDLDAKPKLENEIWK